MNPATIYDAEIRIAIDNYFSHPGDKEIIFEVPLDLTEIKHLHYCLLKKLDAEKEEGYMGAPTQDLVMKLEEVIKYLQAEHYGK